MRGRSAPALPLQASATVLFVASTAHGVDVIEPAGVLAPGGLSVYAVPPRAARVQFGG